MKQALPSLEVNTMVVPHAKTGGFETEVKRPQFTAAKIDVTPTKMGCSAFD
jgi:hypothetical protein